MKGIGRVLQIGVAKEATRGTAEATASYWIPWAQLSIDDKDKRVEDEATVGVIEGSVGQSIVSQWSEATYTAPIGNTHLPLILLSVFGSMASAVHGSETVVYDHTITVQQDAQHQSLTLFTDDPLGGVDYTHALGTVKSFSIDYEQEKFIEYSVEFMAQKGVVATNTPATITEERFLPQHLVFKLASSVSGLSGATAMNIKKLSFKVEPNLQEDSVLGNLSPVDFLNKQFAITGEIEAIWQNESDFKTASLAGSTKAMSIDLINTNVTLGTSANPEFKIVLDKVIFEPVERTISIGDMVSQKITFTAYYDTANSSMVSAVVTNLIASY